MINPKKITQYGLDRRRLQEYLIFWIAVAGKTAKTIAPRIDQVLWEGYRELGHRGPRSPFKIVRELGKRKLATRLKNTGIGCYTAKASAMVDTANAGFDLKTCGRDDLITIKGISFKTANCFLMHSRRNSRCAALDTHVLKFLKDMGYENIPESAPQSLRQHERLEGYFLEICDCTGFTPANLDLLAWRLYAYHAGHKKTFIAAIKSRVKETSSAVS
jgi:hypothetical protein